MDVLAAIVVGLLVGLAARWIIPGEWPGGTLGDLLLGAAGASAGAWIYRAFAHAGDNGLGLPSIVCAGIGAVVLLFIVRALRGRAV